MSLYADVASRPACLYMTAQHSMVSDHIVSGACMARTGGLSTEHGALRTIGAPWVFGCEIGHVPDMIIDYNPAI